MPSEPRITLEQWQALVAVVDAGSYAKAAEALHKSQSTVTYAVQKLEAMLGVKAFEIRGRKAVLTQTGDLLQRRARVLLDEARGLESASRRVSAGWEAEITVAADTLFPYWLLLQCFDRFGNESPHTRIELIESVLAGTTEALTDGRADLAIASRIPPGYVADPLVRLRAIPVAHPDHPLHRLGRSVTLRDLRAHRQLIVRESDALRASKATLEASQRWTVTNMSTSIVAAVQGFGYGWYPEEKIRPELFAGTLKPLPMREGGERFAELYLIFADRENAGPGTVRLAEIIREHTAGECAQKQKRSSPGSPAARGLGRSTQASSA
ncbi:MAG TPA: LysR family transcriptional regulator [Casimicrobiaceae bacterium]